ncbi:UDP-N-acetylglucosamine:LPS N-acetylglucosamine transferase [Fonticella tunisiensis]|uniref:UDP-N-acetylglucosamine:LPS N-acetylglucosamine transferase n=2 Tax=Fonticella tunisiensis TaxID=1096341 RepID=A0A4R7K6L9_9CLOT|nr:UDP-N-acetylglucosamine:LPS N-acetylglucosamine transferase [Fonticella tunisiensis]
MGHLRMANILQDILEGEEDVEIVKYAGSELLGQSGVDIIVKLWNGLIRRNLIRTVDVLVNFFIRIFVLPFIEVSQTVPFYEKLDEIKPDIIISTADGFNKVLGTYASENKIPFYIVITEISTFLDLVNPHATHITYFNETPEAIRNYDFDLTYFSYSLNKTTRFYQKVEYILKYYKDFVLKAYENSIFRNPDRELEQLNNARCRVIGPLAEKKHFTVKNVDEIKEKYNIPKDRDNVVVVSGSIGGKFLVQMAKALTKRYNKPLNLLVMCGRDKKTYEKMVNFKNTNEMINIIPYEYTNNFDEFIAVADCLIVRPSAGIFIESVLGMAPILTFDLVTSNDRGSLTMIEKYKLGEICKSKKELIPALEKILINKEVYKKNIERLQNMYARTYDEKKQLLRQIIFDNEFVDYEEKGSLHIESPLESSISH